jgi:hypothetical protein
LVALEFGRAGSGFYCGDGDWIGPIAIPSGRSIAAVEFPTANTRTEMIVGYVVRTEPSITQLVAVTPHGVLQDIQPREGLSAFYLAVPDRPTLSSTEILGFDERGGIVGRFVFGRG